MSRDGLIVVKIKGLGGILLEALQGTLPILTRHLSRSYEGFKSERKNLPGKQVQLRERAASRNDLTEGLENIFKDMSCIGSPPVRKLNSEELVTFLQLGGD